MIDFLLIAPFLFGILLTGGYGRTGVARGQDQGPEPGGAAVSGRRADAAVVVGLQAGGGARLRLDVARGGRGLGGQGQEGDKLMAFTGAYLRYSCRSSVCSKHLHILHHSSKTQRS